MPEAENGSAMPGAFHSSDRRLGDFQWPVREVFLEDKGLALAGGTAASADAEIRVCLARHFRSIALFSQSSNWAATVPAAGTFSGRIAE